jgi:hypothetical protein
LPRQPGEFGRLIEQLAANGLAGLGVKLERMPGEFADDASATLRIRVALEILRMYEISGDTLQALL